MPESAGASPSAFPYATHLNVLYPPLETIALDPLVDAVRDAWYNQTLARVNESVVRLGVMRGEYHWHEHAADVTRTSGHENFSQMVLLLRRLKQRGNA